MSMSLSSESATQKLNLNQPTRTGAPNLILAARPGEQGGPGVPWCEMIWKKPSKSAWRQAYAPSRRSRRPRRSSTSTCGHGRRANEGSSSGEGCCRAHSTFTSKPLLPGACLRARLSLHTGSSSTSSHGIGVNVGNRQVAMRHIGSHELVKLAGARLQHG